MHAVLSCDVKNFVIHVHIIHFSLSFVVRDVVIIGSPNPLGPIDLIHLGEGQPAVQMEASTGESLNLIVFKPDSGRSVTHLQLLVQVLILQMCRLGN